LGLPKEGRSREKDKFLNTQFWEKNGRSCRNFGVENHISCFDIPNILIVVLIFFNKPWDFVVIFIHVFSNIKKHKLL
jgi:hypothetical protein